MSRWAFILKKDAALVDVNTRAARFLPILNWIRRYDRSYLRADVIAGVTVTALVVPKNLGYAEIARRSHRERVVRRGRRGDPLRDLRHVPADLDRTEFRARGGRGKCGARSQHLERSGCRGARGRDCARRRADLHPAVPPEDGMDLPVHLPRRHHRVPLRRGDRRHHRRTPEDHRQRREWRQRLAEVLVLARGTRRHSTEPRSSSGRCRWRSCLVCVPLRPRCPERSWW